MANRRSTIEFTDITEPLLEELELSGFDIRGIVNGGIFIFSKMSGDKQKEAIAEANSTIPEQSKQEPQTLRDVFKNIVQTAKEQQSNQIKLPKMVIQITPADEQSDWFKALGPKLPRQKKKAKGG